MIASTTPETKITLHMSDRAPLRIVKADWPSIAYGSAYSGEHGFQAFEGACIRVRQHADGRTIVTGCAGDWNGCGRPDREGIRAGFLLEKGEDIVRAIRRVAGILAGTNIASDCADPAARACIADLPAEDA